MAATATAIAASVPLAAYAGAVVASVAVTTTRPAQSTLIPSVSVTPDQLTAANMVVSWVEAAGIASASEVEDKARRSSVQLPVRVLLLTAASPRRRS